MNISKCKPEWNMPNYVETAIKKIKEVVGSDEVILGLSGGVDSSVAAALIHKAIGNQLSSFKIKSLDAPPPASAV